jgi:transcriptional regulator with PAS, ATPase and Fis domain
MEADVSEFRSSAHMSHVVEFAQDRYRIAPLSHGMTAVIKSVFAILVNRFNVPGSDRHMIQLDETYSTVEHANATDSLVVSDTNSVIIDANLSLQTLFRFTRVMLRGISAKLLFCNTSECTSFSRNTIYVKSLNHNCRAMKMTSECLTRSGQTFIAEVQIKPILIDQESFFIWIFRKLSVPLTAKPDNHSEMLEYLDRNQTLIDAIINQISNPIYSKDREGKYQIVNQQFARLASGFAQSVIGSTDYKIFGPEFANQLRKNELKTWNKSAGI